MIATALPACNDTACCSRFCDLSDPQADGDCDAFWSGTQCVTYGSAEPRWTNVGVSAAP